MDKTYAETQGQPPFDWNRFLDRAIAGGITEAEHNKAEALAHAWTTCACGNQCAIIPRKRNAVYAESGVPLDQDLRALGHSFYCAIGYLNYAHAKEILAEIEARSAVLIAEELAKLQ